MELSKVFEGTNVELIEKDGTLFFEIYSTGIALGYVKKNSSGVIYPRKERVDKTLKSAEIKPCVHGGHKYITEEQLYDFMLEAKTNEEE